MPSVDGDLAPMSHELHFSKGHVVPSIAVLTLVGLFFSALPVCHPWKEIGYARAVNYVSDIFLVKRKIVMQLSAKVPEDLPYLNPVLVELRELKLI